MRCRGRRVAAPTPDGQVDRLKIVDESPAETTRRAVERVHIRPAVEQQTHNPGSAAEHGAVEGHTAELISKIHQARIIVQQRTDGVGVSFANGEMHGLTRRRGDKRVPHVAAVLRFEFDRPDHRAPAFRSMSTMCLCPGRVADASGVAREPRCRDGLKIRLPNRCGVINDAMLIRKHS